MRRSLTLLALLVAAAAWYGCDQITSDTPSDVFTFKYVYALPTEAQTLFYYRLTRPDGAPCPTTPDSVHIRMLAGDVQQKGGLYDDLRRCSETFLVGLNEVTDVRNASRPFQYQSVGRNNDAAISVGRVQYTRSHAVDVSEIRIETSGGLTVGQPTTVGAAMVDYLQADDSFTCQEGGPVWAANANRARPSFFEMTLTEQTAEEAAGDFQCIARNEDDDQDPLLLVAFEGSFRLGIQP